MMNSVPGRPSVSTKTIAKVDKEQEMLEDWHVTVRELCERTPEVSNCTISNLAGEFYDKNIQKMPQRMRKCIATIQYLYCISSYRRLYTVLLFNSKHSVIMESKYPQLVSGTGPGQGMRCDEAPIL